MTALLCIVVGILATALCCFVIYAVGYVSYLFPAFREFLSDYFYYTAPESIASRFVTGFFALVITGCVVVVAYLIGCEILNYVPFH